MDGLRPGRSCYQEAEEERRGRPKEVEGHDQKKRPYLKWEKLEKEGDIFISIYFYIFRANINFINFLTSTIEDFLLLQSNLFF